MTELDTLRNDLIRVAHRAWYTFVALAVVMWVAVPWHLGWAGVWLPAWATVWVAWSGFWLQWANRMRKERALRSTTAEPYCEGWNGRMDEHDAPPGCEC